MTTQSLLINGFGVLFVILNAFGLGLRITVGKQLAQAYTHWKIAVSTWSFSSPTRRSCPR